eukprot:augustus_masked-scaffold_1-processed-gene-24.10-mRNA-1 protein AED:1.00 eAED:1.00 QI:0/-1/0/0/-1/1/1/0/379
MYKPLPLSTSARDIYSYKDFKNFSQGSPEWHYLHLGRVTGSNVVACLGILEPSYAFFLNIPKVFRGHYKSLKIYKMLRNYKQPENLHKLKSRLLLDLLPARTEFMEDEEQDTGQRVLWYQEEENPRCKTRLLRDFQLGGFDKFFKGRNLSSLRLLWGNLLEPTAVLAAINWASENFNVGFVCYETGIFLSEALTETNRNGLSQLHKMQLRLLDDLHELGCRLGASPDALLKFRNGSRLVIEVKNVFPFYNRHGTYAVKPRKWNRMHDAVPVWDMPQLQLEIFCAGFKCDSAIYVRLTQNAGAKLCKVKRDDNFIVNMLQQILNFYRVYVIQGRVPKSNWSYKQKLVRKLESKLRKMRIQRRSYTYESYAVIAPSMIQRL